MCLYCLSYGRNHTYVPCDFQILIVKMDRSTFIISMFCYTKPWFTWVMLASSSHFVRLQGKFECPKVCLAHAHVLEKSKGCLSKYWLEYLWTLHALVFHFLCTQRKKITNNSRGLKSWVVLHMWMILKYFIHNKKC